MKNVAIIDDEEVYRIFLESEVASHGFFCTLFSDFNSFFDSLDQNPNAYSAIIVDRLVGSEDAVKHRFPESCRQTGYSGPIFLYTNYPASGTAAEQLGFEGIFKKGQAIDWHHVISERNQ